MSLGQAHRERHVTGSGAQRETCHWARRTERDMSLGQAHRQRDMSLGQAHRERDTNTPHAKTCHWVRRTERHWIRRTERDTPTRNIQLISQGMSEKLRERKKTMAILMHPFDSQPDFPHGSLWLYRAPPSAVRIFFASPCATSFSSGNFLTSSAT
jgi:hypothetical protein